MCPFITHHPQQATRASHGHLVLRVPLYQFPGYTLRLHTSHSRNNVEMNWKDMALSKNVHVVCNTLSAHREIFVSCSSSLPPIVATIGNNGLMQLLFCNTIM